MDNKIAAIAVVSILIVAGVGVYMLYGSDDKKDINIDVNLEVFGNADKDDKISENDVRLVSEYLTALENDDQETLNKLKDTMSSDFADANQDGVIDQKDIEQIKSLINNTADYIWILDGVQSLRKISTDINSIGCEYFANTELCLILGLGDKIKAVDYAPHMYRDFYFTESQNKDIGNLGNMNTPNYDEVNKLDMDVLLTFYTGNYEAKQDKIYDCDVIYLGLYNPDLTNTDKSSFVQGVLKAGYIFGVADRAMEYLDWLLGYRDTLLSLANSITESDKPTILAHTYGSKYFQDGTNNTLTVYKPADPLGQAIALGGGHNVYSDLESNDITSSNVYGATVSVDVVLGTNTTVDYIFLHMVRYTYGGSEMTTTPHHGYLATSDDELKAGYDKVKGFEFIEDNMSVNLVAGEFRNGCTGGVLLGAYIGSIANSEVYKDIDPVKIMNEYIGWMGIDNYDAAKDGKFVYPGE